MLLYWGICVLCKRKPKMSDEKTVENLITLNYLVLTGSAVAPLYKYTHITLLGIKIKI